MQLQSARRTIQVATVVATLTGAGLLTYLLWSIPVSHYYIIGSGPMPSNTGGADISLPSFVGPAFYALVGILIGILLTVCVFVLASIFKGVVNSKSGRAPSVS